MMEIYNAMADMTLEALKFLNESKEKKKSYCVFLDEDVLKMVRTTQSLYETINHANQPVEVDANSIYRLCKESDMKRSGRPSFNC